MTTLASVLLLTAVTMAQADQMSDVLKLPPHKHHVYIFDVTSEASVEDLKAALSDFTIEGSYKVLFFVRVEENALGNMLKTMLEISTKGTAALHALTFPADSVVIQHPVEHIQDYLEMFQAERWEKYDPEANCPDAVLLFMDRRWKLPETKCTETFAMEMKEWARQYKETYKMDKPRMYPIISNYPPRILFFSYIRTNALQNLGRRGAPATGGAGAVEMMTKRAIEI